MKVTITMNGKSAEVEFTPEQLKALGITPPPKLTGYETHDAEKGLWYASPNSAVIRFNPDVESPNVKKTLEETANLYSDLPVAIANARADDLFRNLRRFAALNGGCVLPNNALGKWEIRYDTDGDGLCTTLTSTWNLFLCPAIFPTQESALAAIDAYRDELLWYFTEYDPMAPGFWD